MVVMKVDDIVVADWLLSGCKLRLFLCHRISAFSLALHGKPLIEDTTVQLNKGGRYGEWEWDDDDDIDDGDSDDDGDIDDDGDSNDDGDVSDDDDIDGDGEWERDDDDSDDNGDNGDDDDDDTLEYIGITSIMIVHILICCFHLYV